MPELIERNGVLIADSKTVTCRECGASLRSIEESHLQGENCTQQLRHRADYRRKYPDAPVVIADSYEGMTGKTLPR